MMLGASTHVLDQDMRKLAGEPPDENRLKAKIYSQLFGSFTRRLIDEYHPLVQIFRNRALRETEFKLELFVFDQAQLDAYFHERLNSITTDKPQSNLVIV